MVFFRGCILGLDQGETGQTLVFARLAVLAKKSFFDCPFLKSNVKIADIDVSIQPWN